MHISISDESFRHPVFYADGGRFTAAHRERETEKDYGQAPVSRSSEPSPELFSRPKGAANLPDFIQAFCVTNPNDLDLLRQRGVFNLPEPTFQQTILDRYAEFFQPILPVVDYAAFYGVVTGTRPGPRVSLLLYYAVMFAGVGAMEADLVLRQAYMSKKAVRELFYDKAQVRVRRLFQPKLHGEPATNRFLVIDSVRHECREGPCSHLSSVAVAPRLGQQRQPQRRHLLAQHRYCPGARHELIS